MPVKSENHDTSKQKREIRKMVLGQRDALAEGARRRASLLLTERIAGHQWFYGAESLLCFVSYGSEISTRDILLEAFRAGKKVYVPKVMQGPAGETGAADMEFFRIFSMEELAEGYRGIPEPPGNTERYSLVPGLAERTLMLMPGVAFDRYRNRIGYGKGFYDRFLADRTELQLRTIAVGFRCQLLERLPVPDRDIRPCQVICT